MTTLRNRDEEKLRETFNLFDLDRSGHISKKELKKVFVALKISLTEKEIQSLIQSMDADGNGEVSYQEFKSVMAKRYFPKLYRREQLYEAFQRYDIDGNGVLTVDEIQNVMSSIGRHMTRTEVKSMIQTLDTDRNGKISFDEFLKLFD